MENLNKYIYKLLLDNLDFDIKYILKVNYIWKKYYNHKYNIKGISVESPTTGLFFLIIKEYLEWCGIIESEKNQPFYTCIILKNNILNIEKKISDLAIFYNKLNNI